VRHFFLALASSLLITSQSLAWPDSLRPIDQCSGDPSFAKFQDRLKRVVLKKDQKALLNLLAPDVLVDFGGGSGRKAFEERWSFDPHEYCNVWDQLETMLKLGCARDAEARIIPSLVMQLGTDSGDSEPVLILPGAKLHNGAGDRGPGANVRPWTLAAATSRESDTMTGVRLPDGRKGYVADSFLYEPLGYRMTIERRRREWTITMFVAGD
jgi:hypothetical protein